MRALRLCSRIWLDLELCFCAITMLIADKCAACARSGFVAALGLIRICVCELFLLCWLLITCVHVCCFCFAVCVCVCAASAWAMAMWRLLTIICLSTACPSDFCASMPFTYMHFARSWSSSVSGAQNHVNYATLEKCVLTVAVIARTYVFKLLLPAVHPSHYYSYNACSKKACITQWKQWV